MSGAVAQVGVPARHQAQGRRSSLTRSRIRAAWLFIAPSLVVLALIAGWPLVRTIWFSFTDADLNNLSDYDFIGFENYLANYDGEWLGLLTEPDWWHSVWNTVWFTLVSVSLETVLGIVVALILNAAFPGRGLMRAIILIPWAIPTIVSAKMWNWMLHDQFGVINDMLLRIGLIAAPITWTANPDTALWTAVMVDVWKHTSFMALLILAALQMLPQDIYEAAKVDGVSPDPRLLPRDAAAHQAGAAGGGDLPLTRCLTGFRSHLRPDLELEGHGVDVGLCAPAARRFPGGRLRVGRLDADLPHHRAARGHHAGRRARAARGGSAMRILARIGFWLLVIVIAVFALFPFYYAIVSSFRSGSALFSVAYLPERFDLSNYIAVFERQPFGQNILNSIIVSGCVVALSLALGITASYAFGRIAFRGRSLLLMTILAVSMFPQVAVLAGMFELIRAFGLYNTLPGLILANLMLTLPFTIWVLTTFMRELPKEIEEAAFVDGATPWIVVRRVFLPLMAPAAVTTGLLAFIVSWNEFLFALTFTLTNERRTVPPAIALMSGSTAYELPWGTIMAGFRHRHHSDHRPGARHSSARSWPASRPVR